MSETVADYLLKRLGEWGVERIYGFPGDGINGLLAALERAGDKPKLIQVRHEEMAAFMACAHAKFTGEVGVCPGNLGAGGDSSPERSVRCQDGSSAGCRHCWSIGALGDGRTLSAGS